MNWFRFYHEALDDPKVQRLPPDLFKFWVNLLCLANRGRPRGALPPVADVAFALRVSEAEAASMLAELARRELLDRAGDGYAPHGWRKRQHESDDVTARVRKHRGQQRGETLPPGDCETFHETLHETPPDTETDPEQSRPEEKPPQPPAAKRRPAAPGAGAPPSEPYRLFVAMAEETGADAARASPDYKRQQAAIAKRLIADGHDEAAVRGCCRFLMSQGWRTGLVDLRTVQKEIGRWAAAGRPAAERPPARASPSRAAGYTADELARIARGERL